MSEEIKGNDISENMNKYNEINMQEVPKIESNTVNLEIIVTSDNILKLLTSSQIKERIIGYSHIKEYPEHIQLLQNEKQILAIEAAIDALNQIDNIKCIDVEKLFVNIGANKMSLQKKAERLLNKIAEKEFDNVYIILLEQLQNKSKKVVAETLKKFVDYEKQLDEMKVRELSGKLKQLFNNGDEVTKRTCVKICILFYQVIGDDLIKDIEGIKPILMKEILGELEKQPKKKVPLDIKGLNFNSTKWNERLEAMNALKESLINREDGEIISLINQGLGDSNLQVVMAAIECVRNGIINNREVVTKMVMRFREKK